MLTTYEIRNNVDCDSKKETFSYRFLIGFALFRITWLRIVV